MKTDYIIVQAGGKGTRLQYLTANKPKALVPVKNLPLLFHLFRKFPDKRFIIIADYKREVLKEYMEAFADVKYQIVFASGAGTCGGIKNAINLLPDDKSFMLIWSDLLLTDEFQLPEQQDNYVGISQTFPCRWGYRDGLFIEESSEENGVAGLFLFKNKSYIEQVPESGEFVKWMREQEMRFTSLGLAGTKEFGTLTEYEGLGREKCRPFNKITCTDDTVIKEGIDEQGKKLARIEARWYDYTERKGLQNIPRIYSTSPLRMERITGKNVYEYSGLTYEAKHRILQKLIDSLRALHSLEKVPADTFSIKKAYYGKTMDRLRKVRDLIPFAGQKTIMVNGRECRNVYYYKRELERKLDALHCGSFTFIHGDCTFSNMMLKNGTEPIFIDPRGYFGYTKLYGDPNYDWAKLYYSIVGNYDRFNLKDFHLNINENTIDLKIESNRWESLEQDFFVMSGTDAQTIKLLHAVIWLSLTTYTWQDYDSICGAFYNGLYYLEEAL